MTFTRRVRCESSACVEVTIDGDEVLVTSTTGGAITRAEWEAFLAEVKAGYFDLPYFRPLDAIQAYVRLT